MSSRKLENLSFMSSRKSEILLLLYMKPTTTTDSVPRKLAAQIATGNQTSGFMYL